MNNKTIPINNIIINVVTGLAVWEYETKNEVKENSALAYAGLVRVIKNLGDDCDQIESKWEKLGGHFNWNMDTLNAFRGALLKAREVIDIKKLGDTKDSLTMVRKNDKTEVERCSGLFSDNLMSETGTGAIVSLLREIRSASLNLAQSVPVAGATDEIEFQAKLLDRVLNNLTGVLDREGIRKDATTKLKDLVSGTCLDLHAASELALPYLDIDCVTSRYFDLIAALNDLSNYYYSKYENA
ncbi:MAG: hypothetical protein LBR91_03460 [Puniceicoccales bacterium]|jgi:hypothetical protein|nr:hypothetical protein [Puniceicoccales bacterium]